VPEDQLSLAIGRDGQNARLAAKLTGWRIDIKSLPESISDWLFNLQKNEELKEIAAEEKEAIAQAEDIMARKAEGRVISIEENDALAAFNDRLERRSVRKQQEKFEKYQKLHKEAFDMLPKGAFEMGIDGTGLPLNIQDALKEAGFDNAGKLVLASKVNSETLLEISGVGPKTLERIAEFADELPNLVPQVEETLPEEPVVEVEAADEVLSEEPVVDVSTETETSEAATESAEVLTVEAEVEPTSDTADEKPAPEKELSFDEIFTLKPEVFEPAAVEEDEEETEGSSETSPKKKKKNKKAGQFRELEYDPDKDVTVAKKKHKRGDSGEWEDF
jgi:N utilization substance protein A